MSRLRTIALAIKDRLEEIPELKGNAVVFRRSDIESEFEKRMAKTRGRCVIIRLIRGRNFSREHKKVRRQGTYTVSLFTVPLLTQKEVKDADQLMEEIDEKLQGWWPDNVPTNGLFHLGCGDLTFPEDPQFDVASLVVEAPQKLT